MMLSSAGGLLSSYKPVVLAGSKEPLKVRHLHHYHRLALKGFREHLFIIARRFSFLKLKLSRTHLHIRWYLLLIKPKSAAAQII